MPGLQKVTTYKTLVICKAIKCSDCNMNKLSLNEDIKSREMDIYRIQDLVEYTWHGHN